MVNKIAVLLILSLMLTQWVSTSHATENFNHNNHTSLNITIEDSDSTATYDNPLAISKNCKECKNSCHSQCHSHLFVQNTAFISDFMPKKHLSFYDRQSFRNLFYTPDSPPPNAL